MKHLNLLVLASSLLIFTACGSTTINNTTVDEKPITPSVTNFSGENALECNLGDGQGDYINLFTVIPYSDNIISDSFIIKYTKDNGSSKLITPTVDLSGSGSLYKISREIYVPDNDTDVGIWHIVELKYVSTDGSISVSRGGCYQNVYVNNDTITAKCPYTKKD